MAWIVSKCHQVKWLIVFPVHLSCCIVLLWDNDRPPQTIRGGTTHTRVGRIQGPPPHTFPEAVTGFSVRDFECDILILPFFLLIPFTSLRLLLFLFFFSSTFSSFIVNHKGHSSLAPTPMKLHACEPFSISLKVPFLLWKHTCSVTITFHISPGPSQVIPRWHISPWLWIPKCHHLSSFGCGRDCGLCLEGPDNLDLDLIMSWSG